MTGGIRIDHYDCRGPDGGITREPLLRFGSDDGPRVLLSLPLFEEFNRTRTFGVTLLHALAARGIGGLLPDWPGTGESLQPTGDSTLAQMRAACAALVATEGELFAIGIRSGALIDSDADVAGRWHLSPVTGTDFVRELRRLADRESGDIAGNPVNGVMMAQLAEAVAAPARTVRLIGDPRPADRAIEAPPLWRRAEPGNDPALAALLADDIAAWIADCAG